MCVSVNVYRHPKDTHFEDGRKIHTQSHCFYGAGIRVCITHNIQ